MSQKRNKVNYKGIEGLEKINKLYDNESSYSETSNTFNNNNKSILIHYFMKSIIIQLKSMQKEIDDNWRTLEYYKDYIIQANEKIKRLEQKKTYYPFTEEEIRNIKVGGTD